MNLFSTRCFCRIFLNVTAVLMALTARAEITWESTTLTLRTTSNETSVPATFTFRNTGTAPVRILSIDSGCSCTTHRDLSAAYAPGANHDLTFDFSVGGRVGRQEREILVVTDDNPEKGHRLRLIVEITELIQLSSRLLIWRTGDAVQEKSVEVTLARPAQTKIDPPTCASDDFVARIEPTKNTDVFRIVVKPKDTAERRNTIVTLPVQIENRSQSLSLFVSVK